MINLKIPNKQSTGLLECWEKQTNKASTSFEPGYNIVANGLINCDDDIHIQGIYIYIDKQYNICKHVELK